MSLAFREQLLSELFAMLPDAVIAASREWAAARMGFIQETKAMAEKGSHQLMLFIVRTVHPELVFTEEEEAIYRAVGKDRLRSLKSDGVIPRILADTRAVNR